MLHSGRTDFLGELVNLGHDVGDFFQRHAQIFVEQQTFLHHGSALFHVVHGFARFFLDAQDQFGNFLSGLRGFFGQLADFFGDDGKTKPVLAGARRFDGGVQGQQVGLFGEVVDDFYDLADVVCAAAEHVDNLGGRLNRVAGAVQPGSGLIHGDHAGLNFFARPVRNIDQQFRRIGDALNRSDHLIDRRGSFGDAGGLHLRVLDHVLHVDAHFVHGGGHFVDRGSRLHADFGGFVGGAGHLSGAAGHLRGAVANLANHLAKAAGHLGEGASHGVLLRTRLHGHRELALSDCRGDGSHVLEVHDHLVEVLGQQSYLIGSADIDRLIQVAGFGDALGHFN